MIKKKNAKLKIRTSFPMNIGKDEKGTKYKCHICGSEKIRNGFIYCPDCGAILKFEGEVWVLYDICPICGTLHDDGAVIKVKGKQYFICFDCSEKLSDEEIKKIIEEK